MSGNEVNNKLYVGNLSYSTRDQDLLDAFAPHGNVVSASVVTDRDSGQSRGFGFVEYAAGDEAQHAADSMNGTVLGGRTLNVNIAKPRDGGGGGRGATRGGGHKGW